MGPSEYVKHLFRPRQIVISDGQEDKYEIWLIDNYLNIYFTSPTKLDFDWAEIQIITLRRYRTPWSTPLSTATKLFFFLEEAENDIEGKGENLN
jgi:hypothetical protein